MIRTNDKGDYESRVPLLGEQTHGKRRREMMLVKNKNTIRMW
jgi:hypothetical protein